MTAAMGRCRSTTIAVESDVSMTGLYVFMLAAGLPLLLWFAFSGADADGLDLDADSDGVLSVIPLSTIAFVFTFFGGTGVIGGWLGTSAVVTFVLALIVGSVAGGLNSAAFTWLRRNSTSSDVSDRDLEGSIARVALDVTPDQRGRIILDIGGARSQMTAAPVDGTDIEVGARVIVVGVEGGVALVTRLDPEFELD